MGRYARGTGTRQDGRIRKDAGNPRPLPRNAGTRGEEKHPIWEVASSHMARRVLVGNLYKEVKDPNLIANISGHVENSRAFSRYRDIDEEMAKEVILKLE